MSQTLWQTRGMSVCHTSGSTVRIVFFGTSSFAAEVLDFLSRAGCEIIAIVTRPDRPRGRSLEVLPSPVKAKALRLGFKTPIFTPVKASTEEFASTLSALKPDLFLVVAYGEIIKQNLLDVPHFGCINIHASLLPKYRGAAPIQRCIMNGETESGISIIEMVLALDAGPILKKISVPVGENTTFGELEKDLLEAACNASLTVIRDIEQGSSKKIEQDHALATYAAKLGSQEEQIDWEKGAAVLHNQIRALSPFPGAWCRVRIGAQEKRLKIKRSMVRSDLTGKPREILERTKNSLVVACGQKSLQLLEIQMEGKKTMLMQEFLQGIQLPIEFLPY